VLPQPRRRWAFFPRSVISDHENPSAHLYRAIARQISSIEDEARFYEERANPWLRGMLTSRGATSFRRFQEDHPDVSYITYEPRTGHQLAEWLTLALATIDIVVVDSAAPSSIVQWIGELTRPQLHTFLLDPDSRLAADTEQSASMQWYRGLCTRDSDAARLTVRQHQHLITFGPSLPELGQNGNATRHVDATAEGLVNQLVEAVDSSIIEQPEIPGPTDEHGERT
jgi:hypothetical protein